MTNPQEIRNPSVLSRILSQKELFGTWRYVISEAQGTTTHKEHYAFLWNEVHGSLLYSGQVETSKMERPPFVATFKFDRFDFTLLNCHIVYGEGSGTGSKKPTRQEEIVYLAEIVEKVLKQNKEEKDLMVVGDFNNPPDHLNWRALQQLGYTAVFKGSDYKTTVALNDNGNLYDNIWLNERYTGRNFTGNRGVCNVYDTFVVNSGVSKELEELRNNVSDHKPIWSEFRCDIDEDTPTYGDLSNLQIG
jgi:endonuclease/exonuclease/phosphatase family metal-dependent hydrolase